MLDFRRDLQVIFQDPQASLNPSMVVADIVGEPLTIHFGLRGKERDARVAQLLERVGLAAYHLERYPSEFSGGQRQRIAVARALALEPRLIVCDEPVSALDVSTQSQAINLLEELQESFGIAYLFIAHDLAVVQHISHRVGVMYLGRLVELGPADRVHEQPAHPYTEMLLAAAPVADVATQRQRKAVRRQLPATELPSPIDPPSGCPFHTRCTYAMDICRREMPEPTPIDGGGLGRLPPAVDGAEARRRAPRRNGGTRLALSVPVADDPTPCQYPAMVRTTPPTPRSRPVRTADRGDPRRPVLRQVLRAHARCSARGPASARRTDAGVLQDRGPAVRHGTRWWRSSSSRAKTGRAYPYGRSTTGTPSSPSRP